MHWPFDRLETTLALGVVLLALLALVVLLKPTPRSTDPCTYYASPQGTGTACTQAAPCLPGSWWPLAGPGKTLCLLDGEYRGAQGMLAPPAGLAGTPTAPITLKALHEGQVLLDAEHQRSAVFIPTGNDWYVIEGFNARHGKEALYAFNGSHNRGRRLIGWEGTQGEADSNIFKTGRYVDNIFEDVAAWGDNVRKPFDGAQSLAPDSRSGFSGYRRAWGEFNGWPQGVSQPTNTYQMGYRTREQRFENVIGTWNTLGATGGAEGVFSNFYDCNASSLNMYGSALLGSLFYVVPGQRFDPTSLLTTFCTSHTLYQDVAAILGGGFTTKYPFSWINQTSVDTPTGNRCVNCLAVHNGSKSRNQDRTGWTLEGFREAESVAAATGGQSIFTVLPGLCYRYEGGVLTSQGLWPWPMNQRIKDASLASGRPVVDVTQTVESLLGPIPDQCRWDRQPVPPQPPSGPLTLACSGALSSAPGTVTMTCTQQERRR